MKQEDIICAADVTPDNAVDLASQVIQRYKESNNMPDALFWENVVSNINKNLQKLLRVEEVADLLQVDIETVRRYVRSGKLPAIKLGGKYIRISKTDLDEFLKTLRL